MREFETGATRDADKPVVPSGFLSADALFVFCQYMARHRVQKDGSVRDADNWKKGIPRKAYYESLIRHILELQLQVSGSAASLYPEEEHTLDDTLCAIWFNVQGLLHERALGRDVAPESQKLRVPGEAPAHIAAPPPAAAPHELRHAMEVSLQGGFPRVQLKELPR